MARKHVMGFIPTLEMLTQTWADSQITGSSPTHRLDALRGAEEAVELAIETRLREAAKTASDRADELRDTDPERASTLDYAAAAIITVIQTNRDTRTRQLGQDTSWSSLP